MKPKRKVQIFIFMIALFLGGFGYYWFGLVALPWGILSLLGVIWLLPFYTQRSLRQISARPILGSDPQGLNQVLQRWATQADRPAPSLWLLPSPAVQMFSQSGYKKVDIFLTEGMLHHLNANEIQAMLAREWAKNILDLGRADHLIFALISGQLKIYWGFKRALSALTFFTYLPRRPQALFLFSRYTLKFVAWWCLPADHEKNITQVALSLEGVEPQIYAQSLWKIESFRKTKPFKLPYLSLEHMCTVNPNRHTVYSSRIYPPIKLRITWITGTYPVPLSHALAPNEPTKPFA